MKKRVLIGALILALTQIALLPSCTSEFHEKPAPNSSQELSLSYTILGATEDDLTRGVPGTASENKIAGLYTLYFEDNTGNYLGAVYTGLSSSTATGTARVGIPLGYAVDQAFKLLFITNIDAYIDKGVHPNLVEYFDSRFNGMALPDVKDQLVAKFNNQNGIKPPLPMSAECSKPAGDRSVSVSLKRVVARVDVLNTFTTDFELISAQVWNAANNSYVFEHAMPVPASGVNTKYKGNVQTATGTVIKTGLYFFENYVMTPVDGDDKTTCLIIGGHYQGGSLKYWRVNIYPGYGSQLLLRNHLYNIKITKVLSDGDDNPEDAYNNDQPKIEYVVNDWEDDFQGGYIVDRYGNGLALSRRTVIFAGESVGEEVVEVMRIYSNTDPISGEWTIDPITGDDADKFETEIINESPLTFFKVRPTDVNLSVKDRLATVTVRWGDLSATMSLKQITPLSNVQGMRATPSNLWFPAEATTEKTFQLDLLGNHYEITDPATQIQTAVVWGANDYNWLTVGLNADKGAGVYEYKVTPQTLPVGMGYRDATIKLTTLVNGVALSASVYVKQSDMDEETIIQRRQLQIEVYRAKDDTFTDYENLGSTSEAFSNFAGFPQDKVSLRDLHFSLNEKKDIKYKIKLTSDLAWWIEPKKEAASRLDFSLSRHDGVSNREMEIWVTANKDIINDAANPESSSWGDAWFDICFENGDRETFHCHQRGVLAVLPKDNKIYYYETMFVNGRYWLDRNLGATASGYYNGATGNGNPEAVGQRLTRVQSVCPKGFRLPKKTSTKADEWDWIKAAGKFNFDPEEMNKPIEDPSNLYYQGFSVEYSQAPYLRFYLPQEIGPEKAKDLSSYWEYENDMVLLLNGTSTAGPGTTQHIGSVDGGRYLTNECDHWSVAGTRQVVYLFNGLHYPDYGSGPCNQIYTEISYRMGGGACISVVTGVYDCNYSLARCIRDDF